MKAALQRPNESVKRLACQVGQRGGTMIYRDKEEGSAAVALKVSELIFSLNICLGLFLFFANVACSMNKKISERNTQNEHLYTSVTTEERRQGLCFICSVSRNANRVK